jgi:hypothetical protein
LDICRWLNEVDTYGIIAWALNLGLSMLRADRADKAGFRHVVPFTLLRLGLGPLCLDFCMAWENETKMIKDTSILYPLTPPSRGFGMPRQDPYEVDGYAFGPPELRYVPLMVALTFYKLRLHHRLLMEASKFDVRSRLLKQLKELSKEVYTVNMTFWVSLLIYLEEGRPSDTLHYDAMHDRVDSSDRLLLISYDAWNDTFCAQLRLQDLFRKYGSKTWRE